MLFGYMYQEEGAVSALDLDLPKVAVAISNQMAEKLTGRLSWISVDKSAYRTSHMFFFALLLNE